MTTHNVYIYSWYLDETETEFTMMRVYGIDEKNNNVCLHINNFTPYCYIELPEHINWSGENANILLRTIKQLSGQNRHPVRIGVVYKQRLYYSNLDKKYQPKKFPYLICSFNHVSHLKNLSYRLNKPIQCGTIGMFKLNMHEYCSRRISPVLQLTSVKDIPPTGWISFRGQEVKSNNRTTAKCKEYSVRWQSLKKLDLPSIAHPMVMSFDIEANSKWVIKMPDANIPEDVVFQISCIFTRQQTDGSMFEHKVLLSLGNPQVKNYLEDVEVRIFDTEYDLLVGYKTLLDEFEPNVIIGWNIFGFDLPYLHQRAINARCVEYFYQGFNCERQTKLLEKRWSSGAYGNQIINHPDAEGVIYIDMMHVIKKDYKLSNYRLATVAIHFFKTVTKDPLSPQDIFKCYKIGMTGTPYGNKLMGVVGKYCVKDSVLVSKIYDVATTWYALCEMSKVTNVTVMDLVTRGQQLKVFSQIYKECSQNGIVVENGKYYVQPTEQYVGALVFTPKPGLYKDVVPLDFASLYPTAIISHNISYDTLVTDENIPDSMCHVMEWVDHIGCEHDPNVIKRNELNARIKEIDEKKKEITQRKKKHKKGSPEYEMWEDHYDDLSEQRAVLAEKRDHYKPSNRVICAIRKYRWLKSPQGILPAILTRLLEARASTRAYAAKLKSGLDANDPTYFATKTLIEVLNKRQLALKVSANSCYGIMGVRNHGMLPFMPGAMCTTYVGRTSILKVDSLLEENKAEAVYGDTDSRLITFPHLAARNAPLDEIWEYARVVAERITAHFPPPMKLEFEDVIYHMFYIITKKRYMSISYKDGQVEDKISNKGVLLSRRDNCSMVRDLYSWMMKQIFAEVEISLITNGLIEHVKKMFTRQLTDYKQFVITKSIKSTGINDINDIQPISVTEMNEKTKKDQVYHYIGEYKVKLLPIDEKVRERTLRKSESATESEYYLHQLPAVAQLGEKMKQRGQLVQPGSRLEYVITDQGPHESKQWRRIESAEYYDKHRHLINLDYLYYLKAMSTPFDQVINIMVKGKPELMCHFNTLNKMYKERLDYQKVLRQLKDLFKPTIKIR